MWVNDNMRERARRVNLILFLQKNHPELIIQRESGEYAYTRRTCITFFQGKDGVYRYCDHELRKQGDWNYSGDGIGFLMKYVEGYTFPKAVSALLEFEKESN